MQKLLPRSPYERLGGYVHLPRLIDKARLHRKGLLDWIQLQDRRV